MKDLFEDFGINISLLLAGFFGSLLLVKKEGGGWKESIMTLLTGAFAASYLTPLILEPINVTNQNVMTGVGFLVGFGGLKIAQTLLYKYTKNIKNDSN
jgi:uncharacterized membrane protein YeaQ/YmgE (transglycosylase-associated protein family)